MSVRRRKGCLAMFPAEDACVLARWGGKVVLTNERKPCPDPTLTR